MPPSVLATLFILLAMPTSAPRRRLSLIRFGVPPGPGSGADPALPAPNQARTLYAVLPSHAAARTRESCRPGAPVAGRVPQMPLKSRYLINRVLDRPWPRHALPTPQLPLSYGAKLLIAFLSNVTVTTVIDR